MPTYKNNTNLRPLLNGKVVNPGQIVHSLSYHDEDEVGLFKIDDKPYYNPIILSVCLKESKEVLIPKKTIWENSLPNMLSIFALKRDWWKLSTTLKTMILLYYFIRVQNGMFAILKET